MRIFRLTCAALFLPLSLLGEISFKGVLLMGPRTQVLLSADGTKAPVWKELGDSFEGFKIEAYEKSSYLLTLRPAKGEAIKILLEDAKTQTSPAVSEQNKPGLDMDLLGEILATEDSFEKAHKRILEVVQKSGRRLASVELIDGVETISYTRPGFVMTNPPPTPALELYPALDGDPKKKPKQAILIY